MAEQYGKQALDRAAANPNMGPKHPDTLAYVESYAITLEIQQRPEEAAAIRAKYHPK
jgi:hypothetical protein